MLSRSKIPSHCVKHLHKIFDGIETLSFRKDEATLDCLVSAYEEKVALAGDVVVHGRVEHWLQNLEREIHASLKGIAFKALKIMSFSALKIEWLFHFPSQTLYEVFNLKNVFEIDKALNDSTITELKSTLVKNIEWG